MGAYGAMFNKPTLLFGSAPSPQRQHPHNLSPQSHTAEGMDSETAAQAGEEGQGTHCKGKGEPKECHGYQEDQQART